MTFDTLALGLAGVYLYVRNSGDKGPIATAYKNYIRNPISTSAAMKTASGLPAQATDHNRGLYVGGCNSAGDIDRLRATAAKLSTANQTQIADISNSSMGAGNYAFLRNPRTRLYMNVPTGHLGNARFPAGRSLALI